MPSNPPDMFNAYSSSLHRYSYTHIHIYTHTPHLTNTPYPHYYTIHSTLHYCAPAWQPWLAKSNALILERIQNRALRILTGQLADTPLECLRAEAEITSFVTTCKRNCVIAWEKSARLPPDNPRHAIFTAPIPQRWKRSSFTSLAQSECERIQLANLPRERFWPKKAPPWSWITNPLWTIATRLAGNSNKSCDKVSLLRDTVDTIAAAGHAENTIYTDGSASRGFEYGGSAAVVTSGLPTSPEKQNTISRKGRRFTSSFETEVVALLLAIEWVNNDTERHGPIIICTDSQSTLAALQSPGKSDGPELMKVRRALSMLNRRVFIQWVPGHIGLIGNEWVDSAAGDAAAMTTEAETEGEISYQSAKAFIGREINDPPISHARTKMVFDGKRKATALSRKDAVMLAQLRSGHCHKLAAYRNIVDAESSPYCPHCKDAPETLEHWLQECPATAQKRIRGFGGAAPPLSVLVENPEAVIAFAHRH